MGNYISQGHQPKENRIIYVTDKKKGRLYPIKWPESYVEFIQIMNNLFPSAKKKINKQKDKNKSNVFYFEDAGKFVVCIKSQETYAGLIPKHQEISPGLHLYYVSLEKWSYE